MIVVVDLKQMHKRGGLKTLFPPLDFNSLKTARDEAEARVRQSDPEDMLRATVEVGGSWKYQYWIDADGKFKELNLV